MRICFPLIPSLIHPAVRTGSLGQFGSGLTRDGSEAPHGVPAFAALRLLAVALIQPEHAGGERVRALVRKDAPLRVRRRVGARSCVEVSAAPLQEQQRVEEVEEVEEPARHDDQKMTQTRGSRALWTPTQTSDLRPASR